MLKHISGLLITLFLSAFSLILQAAHLPEGVMLAEKQNLVKTNGSEPGSIDPHKVEGVPGSNIVLDLFEGLTVEGPDGNIIPAHAESWKAAKDKLSYTFKLRKGLRWSNGDPLTAQDFVNGMRRVLNPKTASPYSYLLYPIKNAKKINEGKLPIESLGIKAPDPLTVEIQLEYPTPYILEILSQPTASPAHLQSIKKWGNQFTRPGHLVSNGAYKLESAIVNGHITLVKNPNYWNADHTIINQVKYLPIVDNNTAIKMYQSSEVDWTYTINSNQFKTLLRELKGQVLTAPYFGLYYYDFNMQKPPFGSKTCQTAKDKSKPECQKLLNLRKALSMAVNRVAMTKYVLGQGQLPAYNFMPKNIKGVENVQYDWADTPYKERLEMAKALFKTTDYSEKNPLKFTLVYNTFEEHKKIALALRSMWKSTFGKAIELKIENQEWKVFLKTRQEGNYQMARDAWIGDYNYATAFSTLYVCGSTQNNSHYCNPEVDALVQKAKYSHDTDTRKKLNTQAQKLAMEDYPILPIYQYVTSHLVKPYLKGYTGKNILDHNHTKDWYLTKHRKEK